MLKIDFKVSRGNDKRDLSLSAERPYVVKRDSLEVELQNKRTFHLANLKIGSNEDESSTSSETYSVSFTSTPGIATSSGFEYDILEAHNKMRALYCVKSFSLNETLVKYAAEYATASFSCDNVTLVHSNGLYGENLAAVYSGGYKPIDVWYDEIKEYDFNNSGYNESTGHFTQLVWKSTSQVGCARVVCDNSWGQYTICEYSMNEVIY